MGNQFLAERPQQPERASEGTSPFSFSWPHHFLNQARASRRPARAWFLEIDPVRERLYVCLRVCVCVCVRPRGY